MDDPSIASAPVDPDSTLMVHPIFLGELHLGGKQFQEEKTRNLGKILFVLDEAMREGLDCGLIKSAINAQVRGWWRHEEALAEAPHAARQCRGLQGEAEGMPHSNVASGGVGGGSGGHDERG
jgi:hypothetical protein